ncbi:hypothetical protein AB0R12_36805, partial [Streptomyces niveus]
MGGELPVARHDLGGSRVTQRRLDRGKVTVQKVIDHASREPQRCDNWYPYGEHAPFYYGVKEKIFEKHGIDLEIRA